VPENQHIQEPKGVQENRHTSVPENRPPSHTHPDAGAGSMQGQWP
jgi:hypothetical protein